MTTNVRQKTLKSLAVMSPLGTMFVREGAKGSVSWQQVVRPACIAFSTRPQGPYSVRPRAPRVWRRSKRGPLIPTRTSTRSIDAPGTRDSFHFRYDGWRAPLGTRPCRWRCDVCSVLWCYTCRWLRNNSTFCCTTTRTRHRTTRP